MGADIKGFVELTQGTICRIGGGLEHWAKGYRYAGPDMLYAAALSYWRQGASSMYLFNYDCHRQQGNSLPYTPEEIKVLKEIHDPDILVRKDKRYFVALDMRSLTPDEGGLMPLPAHISTSNKRKKFTIWVGDDVENARQEGCLEEMWLRFTLAKGISDKQQIVVELNGKKLTQGHRIEAPACTTWSFPVKEVDQGENETSISVEKLEQTEGCRVEGIELVITYRG